MNEILKLPWVLFNNELMKIKDDEQVRRLIYGEKKGKRRTVVLLRLYQRYNKLRALRERQELLQV